MEVRNRFLTIRDYIDGAPSESDFEIRSSPLSLQLKVDGDGSDADDDDAILAVVRNLYVSVDPYQLRRMKKHSPSRKVGSIATRLVPGKPINAYGVGEVVASGDPEQFEGGDLVVGFLGWEEYTTVRRRDELRKLGTREFPLSYHVGVLGPCGLTAYVGLYEIGKAKKGEKVFVSAASGAVGNVAGQYSKLSGCYVVGCAGTKHKVDLLKEKLGFDDAFNYKEEPDLASALQRCFPDGIDVYFDNVGGEMLEAAVATMNDFGRVALCGAISEDPTSDGRRGGGEEGERARRAAPDLGDLIYKRITMRGFLAFDHAAPDFIPMTSDCIRAGRMRVLEHISTGLESIPSAFAGLFRGDNVGKTLVQLSTP